VLSPSERQVAHALLTRPPLCYLSIATKVTPFDLNVLGTPPAFILSQDQTLVNFLFNETQITSAFKFDLASYFFSGSLGYLRIKRRPSLVLHRFRSGVQHQKGIVEFASLFFFRCSIFNDRV
jgi:hypothetical protein